MNKTGDWQKELDHKVFDIELIMISIVQGVALTFLGEYTIKILEHFQLEFIFYIFSGFLFILLFWSGAIIHTLSFIDWPPNLGHNFLYFLASFIEILTFSQLDNPLRWFLFTFVFFIVAGILYIYDLTMIKKHEKKMGRLEAEEKLFVNILNQQRFELKYLIPAGLVFNLITAWIIYAYPLIFITKHYHIILSMLQAAFSLLLLFNSLHAFKKRSALITNARSLK